MWHGWAEIDEAFVRLAEIQGADDAQRVEFTINLRPASIGKSKGHDWFLWIQRALECALATSLGQEQSTSFYLHR